MDKTSLGNRMKGYEATTRSRLLRRTPVIIRIDGKAFHTFTKRFEGRFNDTLHDLMVNTTDLLCANIQNAVIGYTQSDEISILLNDWKTLETDQWYGGGIQKIASVSASMATGYFNALYHGGCDRANFLNETAFFDARVFNVPKEEVANYFIWRQQDASRNSIQMLGREFFSHKELHKKNNSQVQDMLMMECGVNWNDLDTWKKRGTSVIRRTIQTVTNWDYDKEGSVVTHDKFVIDEDIPIFTQDRNYIEDLL